MLNRLREKHKQKLQSLTDAVLIIAFVLIAPRLGPLFAALLVGVMTYFGIHILFMAMENDRKRQIREQNLFHEEHHHHYHQHVYTGLTEGYQHEESLPDGRVIREQHVRKWD